MVSRVAVSGGGAVGGRQLRVLLMAGGRGCEAAANQHVQQALLGVVARGAPARAPRRAAWRRRSRPDRAPSSRRRGPWPTSVNFEASTLTKGRRPAWPGGAISVLPTPVGPMSMMFLGAISSRMGGGTCCRRQRLRRGHRHRPLGRPLADDVAVQLLDDGLGVSDQRRVWWVATSQLLEDPLVVGVDADVAGDLHGSLGDLARRQLVFSSRRARRPARRGRRSPPSPCRCPARSRRRCPRG